MNRARLGEGTFDTWGIVIARKGEKASDVNGGRSEGGEEDRERETK